MILTKEILDYILDECDAHRNGTGNDIDAGDVLYSLLNSADADANFYILNDWDEGKANDPHWDDEKNEHSAIVFLKEMYIKLIPTTKS